MNRHGSKLTAALLALVMAGAAPVHQLVAWQLRIAPI